MELGYGPFKIGDRIDVSISDISKWCTFPIWVECDYCHKRFQIKWNEYYGNHRNNKCKKDSCSDCKGIKRSESRHDDIVHSVFERIDAIAKEHDIIILTTPEEYTDIKMKIRFICPKHGEQQVIANDLLNGHTCKYCKYDQMAYDRKYSKEFVIKSIESVNGNILLNPDDYVNTWTSNLQIKCSCGNTYYTNLHGYRMGICTRCPQCSKSISNGELRIREVLSSISEKFIPEYSFSDCKDKNLLPFDFYLPNRNMCIEYDGIQHFEPSFGDKSFDMTIRHDKIKNEYCQQNNIYLLRIPYWEYDNIEKIIKEKIDEIGERNSPIS